MAWTNKRTESSCLPPGEFDGEIASVERATSKKGNDMVVVEVRIEHAGKKMLVKDWIVAGTKYTKPKVAAIAAALGKSAELEAGTFRLSNQVLAPIRVLVTRENSPGYGWANRIGEYKSNGLGLGHDIFPTPGGSTVSYPDPMDDQMPF